MQGFNRYPLAVSVFASVALAGCFGGSSSDDNGDTPDLSPVTAENERDVSIAAAESVGAAGDSQESLTEFNSALSGLGENGSSSQSTQAMAVHPMDAANCTEEDVSISEDGGTVRYDVQGSCTVETSEGDVELSGAYVISAGDQWGGSRCDSPDTALETIFGGDPEFTGQGVVDFRIAGGFGFRQAVQMPSDPANGNYCFNFEYGATSDGLEMESGGRSFSLQPNAFTGILIEATLQGGEVTSLNQEFYTDGVFELAEGEFYEVSFSQDLATQSEDDADDGTGSLDPEDFQAGGQFCPDSGSMTVSGADGSEVVVTFGEDVDGAEVRVDGENTTFYNDCDDFYADEPFSG